MIRGLGTIFVVLALSTTASEVQDLTAGDIDSTVGESEKTGIFNSALMVSGVFTMMQAGGLERKLGEANALQLGTEDGMEVECRRRRKKGCKTKAPPPPPAKAPAKAPAKKTPAPPPAPSCQIPARVKDENGKWFEHGSCWDKILSGSDKQGITKLMMNGKPYVRSSGNEAKLTTESLIGVMEKSPTGDTNKSRRHVFHYRAIEATKGQGSGPAAWSVKILASDLICIYCGDETELEKVMEEMGKKCKFQNLSTLSESAKLPFLKLAAGVA